MRAPRRASRRPPCRQDDLRSSRILLVLRFTLLEEPLEPGSIREVDGASYRAEQRAAEVEPKLDRMPVEEIRSRAPGVQRQRLLAAFPGFAGDRERQLLVAKIRQHLTQHLRAHILSAQE